MDQYVEFPPVAGKTLKAVALFTSPEFRAVTLRFDDDTDLTVENQARLYRQRRLFRLEDWQPAGAQTLASRAQRSVKLPTARPIRCTAAA